MKPILYSITITLFTLQMAMAQDTTKPVIYHPEVNAQKEINEAVAKAKKEHKHVLLQVGGNWCVWCMRFHKLVENDTMLTRLVNENYVVVHVNYSKENKNAEVLKKLDYPQRFGFPVFVVLDANGKRIHTQNSGYLEEGKGHSPAKVAEFLKQWAPSALNPDNYKKDN
ncbi:MAG: thioredoxin family protein [Bacteroidetes bacterium]|nr:thioredoxin family protein [Bacteroidota bacterium]